MDARCVEFVKIMGMEEIYRDGLQKIVDTHREDPAFKAANHTAESLNKIISDTAKALAGEFGRIMEQKFESKHLDALLRFTKETEDGRHAVRGLYMTQVGMTTERAAAISIEFSKKIYARPEK